MCSGASGGWRVDRDYITDDGDPALPSRVGTCSNGWTPEMAADPDAVRFRLLDDDGNVYYGGVLLEAEDRESAGWELLQWGGWDAGAVALDVRNGSGEWEGYMG